MAQAQRGVKSRCFGKRQAACSCWSWAAAPERTFGICGAILARDQRRDAPRRVRESSTRHHPSASLDRLR